MPLPTFTGLRPKPEFGDIVRKMNELADELTNLMLNLDSLNVVSLTADHVDTGTLDANLVTIAADDGSYSYTLDGEGIRANNGIVDTLKFDLATGLLTIVSALVQSTTGYPKVELNSANTLIGAYSDANNYLSMTPSSGGGPGMSWFVGGALSAFMASSSGGTVLAALNNQSLSLQSNGGNVDITAGGSFRINSAAGQSTTINYVKNVVAGTPTFGSMTFTKGILTSFT